MARYIYQAMLTPEAEGGYSVSVPALPGCYTCGDDFKDAVFMAEDAMKTFVATLLKYGDRIPDPTFEQPSEGDVAVVVSFEADEGYIVDGPVVSAAQAARELGVSAGRVTHMIDAGILDGYRRGRRTWVTEKSVEARKAAPRSVGRPKTDKQRAERQTKRELTTA